MSSRALKTQKATGRNANNERGRAAGTVVRVKDQNARNLKSPSSIAPWACSQRTRQPLLLLLVKVDISQNNGTKIKTQEPIFGFSWPPQLKRSRTQSPKTSPRHNRADDHKAGAHRVLPHPGYCIVTGVPHEHEQPPWHEHTVHLAQSRRRRHPVEALGRDQRSS